MISIAIQALFVLFAMQMGWKTISKECKKQKTPSEVFRALYNERPNEAEKALLDSFTSLTYSDYLHMIQELADPNARPPLRITEAQYPKVKTALAYFISKNEGQTILCSFYDVYFFKKEYFEDRNNVSNNNNVVVNLLQLDRTDLQPDRFDGNPPEEEARINRKAPPSSPRRSERLKAKTINKKPSDFWTGFESFMDKKRKSRTSKKH